MAHVEIDSAVGKADWRRLLDRVLPYVDLFLPSLEEVFLMLDPSRYQGLRAKSGSDDLLGQVDASLLRELADELLSLGPAVVGLKLGAQGIYLRTVNNVRRLAEMGGLSLPAAWSGRELLAPTFRVKVTGTTGAGDCAIAGFLTALLKGLSVEAALTSAVAAGASNVEFADAISGIPTWNALQARIQAGWERAPVALDLPLWRYDEDHGLWIGPLDPLHS
jgi:sugar/nucleoside kinase (ribokinase family)